MCQVTVNNKDISGFGLQASVRCDFQCKASIAKDVFNQTSLCNAVQCYGNHVHMRSQSGTKDSTGNVRCLGFRRSIAMTVSVTTLLQRPPTYVQTLQQISRLANLRLLHQQDTQLCTCPD